MKPPGFFSTGEVVYADQEPLRGWLTKSLYRKHCLKLTKRDRTSFRSPDYWPGNLFTTNCLILWREAKGTKKYRVCLRRKGRPFLQKCTQRLSTLKDPRAGGNQERVRSSSSARSWRRARKTRIFAVACVSHSGGHFAMGPTFVLVKQKPVAETGSGGAWPSGPTRDACVGAHC